MPIDSASPSFGLPACLRIPIAATSFEIVAEYVGPLVYTVKNRSGEVVAARIAPFDTGIPARALAPLWSNSDANRFVNALYPAAQFWVHVDYNGYRKAYRASGMPVLPAGSVLDHVQNRRAVRLRGYSHPILRLSPVSRRTNSSGGHRTGGEGMEVEYRRKLSTDPEATARQCHRLAGYQVQYADPMDLTKMLDICPGTTVLNGVRDTMPLLFP